MRGLQGKTAVITGGASGIGRATAHRFAEEGVDVVVTDIDAGGGEETVEQIETNDAADGAAEFRQLDVSDYDRFEECLLAVAESYGGLDVLFNNAGIGEAQSFRETTRDHRDELIDVNLKGVWNGCHAALPIFEESGGGAVVNTASMAGWKPAPITTYALTKAAVLHFTRSVADEFARYDVRINAVCPGLIDTAMTDEWYSESERSVMCRQTALDRWADPTEVASCVAFLASEDASYVTGRSMDPAGVGPDRAPTRTGPRAVARGRSDRRSSPDPRHLVAESGQDEARPAEPTRQCRTIPITIHLCGSPTSPVLQGSAAAT